MACALFDCKRSVPIALWQTKKRDITFVGYACIALLRGHYERDLLIISVT